MRSYATRGRVRPEDECSIRTPFQRDRDRILHSKPFRRLKGKTQVFIDPAGDHYRTRMTHTLETTGIARVVARALGLNEDLTEAIGLGHDMGHPPFGHAGEEALDRALRERFGLGFRHNEQSLAIAEALNLTAEVRDGIRTHTGPQSPRRSRDGSSASSTGSRTSTTTSTTRSGTGILSPDDLPADEIDLLGATGSARDRHARPRPRRDLRRRGRHRAERGDRRRDGRLRTFMFERVYLAPPAREEHERAHAVIRRIFDRLVDRGDEPAAVVDFVVGHDRPLRARSTRNGL